jgi:hypothetical protein
MKWSQIRWRIELCMPLLWNEFMKFNVFIPFYKICNFLPVVTVPCNFNSSFSFTTVYNAYVVFTLMPQNTTAPLPAKGADKSLANLIWLLKFFMHKTLKMRSEFDCWSYLCLEHSKWEVNLIVEVTYMPWIFKMKCEFDCWSYCIECSKWGELDCLGYLYA